MRKFVIGDIHGSYMKLVELLSKIKPDLNQDKIIFLGDYIDRGPNSYKVIQLLINLQKKYGNDHVVLLRGNHEQMAIDNIYRGYKGSFNGYDATIDDFMRNKDSVENYLEFFSSLPLYHEDENFIYVHGGIRPGVSMESQTDNDLLWIRDEFFKSSMTFEKTVVFGHTPTSYLTGSWTPYIKKDRIGIDTGAVFDGHLTAIEIRNSKAIKVYQTKKLVA